MLKVYQCYILPHIEYGLSVWGPYLQKDINILEAAQRRFTRLISCIKHLPYHQRLEALGLPSLEIRRKKIDLIQAYKIWNGIDKVQGLNFTKLSEHHKVNTRMASKENFVQPHARLDLRKNFFTLKVTQDWNNLPHEIQRAPSLQKFKDHLKKLFF